MKNSYKVFISIIVAAIGIGVSHRALVQYEVSVTDSVTKGIVFLLYDVIVGAFLIYVIYKWFKWWFKRK
jgi:cytochrome c biogenesis factor